MQICDILCEIGWSTIKTFSTDTVRDTKIKKQKKNSASKLVFDDDNSSMDSLFFDTSLLFPNPLWVGISPLWVGIGYYTRLWKKKTKSSEMTKLYGATTKHLYIKENSVTAKIIIDDDITR
jgi:hypothetical protein